MGKSQSVQDRKDDSKAIERAVYDGMQDLRAKKSAEWLAANRESIDAYNARVERDGVSNDKPKGF